MVMITYRQTDLKGGGIVVHRNTYCINIHVKECGEVTGYRSRDKYPSCSTKTGRYTIVLYIYMTTGFLIYYDTVMIKREKQEWNMFIDI